MGSGNSKNLPSSSSSSSAKNPRIMESYRRSHSRPFSRSSVSADHAAEIKTEGPSVSNRGKEQSGSHHQGKTLGRKIKDFTRSSTIVFERNQKKLFRSFSDAGNKSKERRDTRVPQSSRRSLSKFEQDGIERQSITEDRSGNAGSSSTVPDNATLRRVKSFGSSEVYSFFSRRLKRQSSCAERRQERADIDHVVHNSRRQEAAGNRTHNTDTIREETHRGLSVEEREQPQPFTSFREVGSSAVSDISFELHSSTSHFDQNISGNVNQAAQSGQSSSPAIATESVLSDSTAAARHARRRGTHEHHEDNLTFRRTHSVGRLRDRVLRRMSTSERHTTLLHGEPGPRETRRHNGRRIWETLTRSSSSRHIETVPTLGHDQFLQTLRSMNEMQRQEVNQNRDPRFDSHAIVGNRSLSLEERRRRARYQVRALQRLSSSFENLAGHERSCILAGHHRTGHCTCNNSSRTDNSNARANISRIIMLAEALFEVLDEIHQQSVALSSRSSISSLGSFPAPADIVNSFPIHPYRKEEKTSTEDDAQCYICLLEYEESDQLRVLPCHHEFHLHCIDKWLKEVHRVCPLCRGNVCNSDTKTEAGSS